MDKHERIERPMTREGLFAYFDQMSQDGKVETTAECLADVGMLIYQQGVADERARCEAADITKGE